MGEETGDAGEGGGTDHGGADLHADGVGGEAFAEAFGSASHEAGENGGEAQAAEDEGNCSDCFGKVEQEENCSEDGGEEAEADEAIDAEAFDNEAESDATSGDAGPIAGDPQAGALFGEAATFFEDGEAPLADGDFEAGVDEEEEDVQPDEGMAESFGGGGGGFI